MEKREIIVRDVLVWYDGAQLFLGIDQLSNSYICLLVEQESIDYLAVRVNYKVLESLLNGKIDLRDLYLNPPKEEYYFVNSSDDRRLYIQKANETFTPIGTMLPRQGFKFSADAQAIVTQGGHKKWNMATFQYGQINIHQKDNGNGTTTLSDNGEVIRSLEKVQSDIALKKAVDMIDNWNMIVHNKKISTVSSSEENFGGALYNIISCITALQLYGYIS